MSTGGGDVVEMSTGGEGGRGIPLKWGVAVEVWKTEYPDVKERGASNGGSGGAGGI